MSAFKCRVSGEDLEEVVDFGMQPLGNGFLLPNQIPGEYFFSMRCGFSETSMLFQLLEQPEAEKMFHENYAFYSSTSKFMAQHFEKFFQSVVSEGYLTGEDPFVVELGCNDGIMLKHFAKNNYRHLGIEPSKNVADVAAQQGINTLTEFFSEATAEKIVRSHGHADAFLAANVMCHIPQILDIARGIKKLLKPTGVAIFEDPYLGDVVKKISYDQIYDEHVFLFSGLSVQYLFNQCGMELIDVLPQSTHGGSMRYVVANKGARPVKESVKKLLDQEKAEKLDKLSTFHTFAKNVANSKSNLVKLLVELKSQGKKVVGYGATSKSTTIFNYCQIGPELIDFIVDTTPIKQGKLTPGMHIPVLPYEAFKENLPEFVFLLAWNHAEEIMQKESAFSNGGGKYIMHVPQVGVI